MANGIMLEELRRVVATPGEISQDTATRLTLSALAELYEKFDYHCQGDAESSRLEQIMRSDLETMKRDVAQVKKTLESNPLVSFGNHLGTHPKLAWFYVTTSFILANLWFIPGFRKLVLLTIGVDPSIISILAP